MERRYYSVKTADTNLKVRADKEYKGLFAQHEVWSLYLLQVFFETAKFLCETENENGIGEAIKLNIGNVQRIDIVAN